MGKVLFFLLGGEDKLESRFTVLLFHVERKV
jgi:hypothetical protein